MHHAKSLGDGHNKAPDRKGLAHIVKKDNTVLGFVDRLKKERESFANLEKVVLKFLPDREVYKTAVRKTVERIVQDGIIEKIVLGRKLLLASKHPGEINPLWILKMLLLRNPSRYIFSLPIETGVLQGASPELLIAKRGSEVLSVPLAGSLPISSGLSNALCIDADGFVRNLDRCNLYDFKELYSKKPARTCFCCERYCFKTCGCGRIGRGKGACCAFCRYSASPGNQDRGKDKRA